MRVSWGGVSAGLLLGAGALVLACALSRKQDAYLTPEVVEGFNAVSVPAEPEAAASMPPVSAPDAPPPMRDAVAPLAVKPDLTSAPPSPAARSAIRPAPESISSSPMFQALLAAPARFMVSRTALASSAKLQGFLSDPKKVDKYVETPIFRGVLDSPALLRGLVSQPAVARAFVTSPAMKDPRAVAALASSPLFRKILTSRGVGELMKDPLVMQQVFMNPQASAWLASNPGVLDAMSRMLPGPPRSFLR